MFFQSQQRSAETGMVSCICWHCLTVLMGNLRNSSTSAAGAVIFSSDTPDFGAREGVVYGKSGLWSLSHGLEHSKKYHRTSGHVNMGGIYFSMAKFLKTPGSLYYTDSLLYSAIYRCIGASDRIFDHFAFLNSVPTTPIKY